MVYSTDVVLDEVLNGESIHTDIVNYIQFICMFCHFTVFNLVFMFNARIQEEDKYANTNRTRLYRCFVWMFMDLCLVFITLFYYANKGSAEAADIVFVAFTIGSFVYTFFGVAMLRKVEVMNISRAGYLVNLVQTVILFLVFGTLGLEINELMCYILLCMKVALYFIGAYSVFKLAAEE